MNGLRKILISSMKDGASKFAQQHGSAAAAAAGFASSSSSCLNSNVDNLSGVFPSLATPFKRMKNEAISYKNLEENIIKLSSLDIAGVSLFDFYGEYPYLNRFELNEFTKVVRNLIGPHKTIIVGSSSESLKKTIEICEWMKKAGASYSLIFTPHYYSQQMTYAALMDYFVKVADKSPIPLIIHNIPSATHIDLPAELVIDLSHHPNIVGFKECSQNIAKIACICEHMKSNRNSDFSVLTGSASFLLDSIRVGAVGTINVLACVLGEPVIELYKYALQIEKLNHNEIGFDKEFFEKAQHLQKRLVEPDLALTETYGIPGLKAALDGFGYYGGPCRLPLLDLNEDQVNDLEMIFKRNGFHWPMSSFDDNSSLSASPSLRLDATF